MPAQPSPSQSPISRSPVCAPAPTRNLPPPSWALQGGLLLPPLYHHRAELPRPAEGVASIEDLASRMMASGPGKIGPGPVRGGNLPEIENAAEWLARDIALPADVIQGLLQLGAKGVIGGGSKSYKTWILSDLAISVATGQDWLGFPTVQGRVLYINLEIQPGNYRQRLNRICEARGVCIGDLSALTIWNLRGYAADLSGLVPKILAKIGEHAYSLIIIDPIYKVLGGRDENKAGDITSLLNEIDHLAVHTGAAVVFGAHFSKGNQAGKESIDRMGGSGVYARDPDTILIVTRHEEENAYTVEATLRNHAPVEPFAVRWEVPRMVRDGELDPTRLKKPGQSGKKYFPDELLAVLGNQELTTGEWLKAAKNSLGASASTCNRLRDDLQAADKIVRSADGKKWRLAPSLLTSATSPTQGDPVGELTVTTAATPE